MNIGTVYVIDGSGNQIQREADEKRPIYRLDAKDGRISRPLKPDNQTVREFFENAIDQGIAGNSTLIAADVVIGLPAEPADVFEEANANTFLEWLQKTSQRLQNTNQDWREELIADGIANRSALKPFVSSIGKGEKSQVCRKRKCDADSNGESVYCLDCGAKQVGKAALQFWFEVLLPLRRKYEGRVAVWPFEPPEGKDIIIAECYPNACQRKVFGATVNKRKPLMVVEALSRLRSENDRMDVIDDRTWLHAASSEDEFDMFITALAFRGLPKLDDLFLHPTEGACTTMEGWMLGLGSSEPDPESGPSQSEGRRLAPSQPSKWTQTGGINKHQQENLGPSGNKGPKGTLYSMVCRRVHSNVICDHKYETNGQDIFQKKCPVCK